MEYGGLSVTDMRPGTPGMPLWCADSFATSMKVRTLNGQTSYVLRKKAFFTPYTPLTSLLFFSSLLLLTVLVLQALISLGRGCWEKGYYFTL